MTRTAKRQPKRPAKPARQSRLALIAAAVVFALAGVFPLANAVAEGPGLPWYGQALTQWLVTIGVVALAAGAIAAIGGPRIDALIARVGAVILAPSSRIFGVGVALATTILTAALTWFAFHHQVFGGDEMAQRFHARVFLSGHLAARAEPFREFFSSVEVLDVGGRWFSQFPAGGSLLIAPLLAVGLEWMLNPILLGVACWAVYDFASHATDEAHARYLAILFACSPFLLFMGASEMNHVPALTFVWLAMAAAARWAKASERRALTTTAAVLGFGFGAAATIRPYDAALLALPVGALQLWMIRAAPAQSAARWRSLGWQLLAGLVPVAIVLFINWQTTGSPMLFGYDALNGPEHRPGFHLAPPGFVHSLARGIYQTSAYLLRLNISLFESPFPALVFVIAALVTLERATRWDHVLLAMIAATLAGYAAYWHEGYFLTGPRFLYVVAPAFIWFVARAPESVASRIRSPVSRRAVRIMLPLTIVVALVMPVNAARIGGIRTRVATLAALDPQFRVDIPRAVGQAGIHKALILVNDSWHEQLASRLRVLGMRPLPARAFLQQVDACELQTALDDEDRLPATTLDERLTRVVRRSVAAAQASAPMRMPNRPPDEALAFVPGRPLAPTCQLHLEAENAGTVPFALFLAHEQFTSSGQLGDVVFARDFLERNELLRPRFGDRPWYRLRLTSSDTGYVVRIAPYQ